MLRLTEELSKLPDVECWTVLKSGGELSPRFAEFAPTVDLHTLNAKGIAWVDAPRTIAARFHEFAPGGVAICNTMATSEFHAAFRDSGVAVLSWIHELPTFIDILGGQSLNHAFGCGQVNTAMTDEERGHTGPFGELTRGLVKGLAAFDHTFL